MATDTPSRYESSAGELSSPPSGEYSEPGSPSQRGKRAAEDTAGAPEHRQKQKRRITEPIETPPPFEEYRTEPGNGTAPPKRFGLLDGHWVLLTASGMPRKKPGRKPGAIVKPKEARGEEQTTPDPQAKQRKPRKPRESSEGTGQRKRKSTAAATNEEASASPLPAARATSTYPNGASSNLQPPPHFSNPATSNSNHNSPVQRHQPHVENHYSPTAAPKRESGYPNSMKSILNDDTSASYSPPSSTAIPVRTSGLSYDPIRGNYDPVRETYSTTGSPRAATQSTSNRSHSIASLIEPTAPTAPTSPATSHLKPSPTSVPRAQENTASSQPVTQAAKHRQSTGTGSAAASEPENKKEPSAPRPVIKESNFATIANGLVKKAPEKMKNGTSVSTPKTDILDELPGEGEGRSILDFGKAKPGEEQQTPTIVLNIPLAAGETNKYINFTRLAEETYGWDALHPRLAANRDRKMRIALAAATLEKESRESGDEMSVDLSDAEGSNPDNGGTSNPEGPAKPKKKRNFKEDQYDIDDEFVDDSDMLWEAQAAASRDGFFVYSGPLIPEEDKPVAGRETATKRGRGGRGSRGGRGGSARGAAATTGRGGGPGSRGGSAARKPRVTKSEKAQREREKAERENAAAQVDKPSGTNGSVLQPTTPNLKVSELGLN